MEENNFERSIPCNPELTLSECQISMGDTISNAVKTIAEISLAQGEFITACKIDYTCDGTENTPEGFLLLCSDHGVIAELEEFVKSRGFDISAVTATIKHNAGNKS